VSKWDWATLSQIAEIVMGQSPSGDTCNKEGKGIPLLNGPTEFGSYHPHPVQYTTDPKKYAQTGDLLFCVRGSTVGRMNWAEQKYAIGRGIAAIRPCKYGKLAPFIRALIELHLPQLLAATSGSTFPNISSNQLHNLPVYLPPLPIQRRIADILGALDDKIEVNRRINRTLEAMAGALYKRWFVDFGPFQDGEFVESEVGLIPEGWTIKPLPEAIEVNPKRTLSKDQVAPYLEMSNMPTSSARVLGWRERAFKSGMRFVNGDVLVARITPCLEHGKTALVDFLAEGQVGWGSTEYIVLHSKPPLPPEYVYFLARSEDFRSYAIKHMTGTSGRQRVPVDCFSSYLIVVPSWESTKEFEQIARLVMATIKQLDTESHKLAATRDYLLPRLLSGEIPVEVGKEAVGT
jgi:type I restriction enzyme S subunit